MGFHLHTLYLFTCNDFLTILIMPLTNTLLSLFAASTLGIKIPETYPEIVLRIALSLVWCWGTLLGNVIHNQRHPDSILEDCANKPWRPIPSKRITPEQSRNLLFAVYAIMTLFSFQFGGLRSFLWHALWCIWYNEWGGSGSLILRNYLNAAGISCFLLGPLEIVTCNQSGLVVDSPKILPWFVMIGLVIFTTIQVQDFRDKVGDALLGRRTLPLVCGDGYARFITVIWVAFWSFVLPAVWNSGVAGLCLSLSLGGFMLCTLVFDRRVEGDKRAMKIWPLWMASFFALPLWRALNEG